MNPRSRRGDRRRWRSRCLTNAATLTHRELSWHSMVPRGRRPIPMSPFSGERGLYPSKGEYIRAPHSPPEGAFSFTCTPFGGVMPPVAENSFPLLSVKEAADYLRMSKDWVYENLKKSILHV